VSVTGRVPISEIDEVCVLLDERETTDAVRGI
jgi:hypothetical protein